ncbi:MAG: dUTP diphosphatase [Bacteriovoracaceae bacterium]|nr:dUTP diphosphatase [Bacteriovoracaceae bacterium]
MQIKIRIRPLEHFDSSFSIPQYMTAGAAGADICVSFETTELRKTGKILAPWERIAVPTGLTFEIPTGYELQVRPRSGLSLKTGLVVINSPGTIDSDYRGELKILIANLSPNDEKISHGMRIAQIVLASAQQAKFEFSETLSATQRGEQGLGSTGTGFFVPESNH